MKGPRSLRHAGLIVTAFAGLHFAAADTLVVEAESGTFTGIIDRHSCWHNVMLTDAPHSTHSGKGAVDTRNAVGSFVEVEYEALWSGLHRVTARYTHIKPDPRPGRLLINGAEAATLTMPQSEALPAWRTESVIVGLETGRNLVRIEAVNEGGLPNMDSIKVAEVREISEGALPRIQILEVEDGRFEGTVDHHSCWNFIAQTESAHSGFTGEGYVDTRNETGSYIEVECDAPAAGPYVLAIRCVHGKSDERPAVLTVNGVVANPGLEFPPNVWWTAWSHVLAPVELCAGRNVIRLTALSAEGLCNIDHFALTPAK